MTGMEKVVFRTPLGVEYDPEKMSVTPSGSITVYGDALCGWLQVALVVGDEEERKYIAGGMVGGLEDFTRGLRELRRVAREDINANMIVQGTGDFRSRVLELADTYLARKSAPIYA